MPRLIGRALAVALARASRPAAAAPVLTVVTFDLLQGGATSGLRP